MGEPYGRIVAWTFLVSWPIGAAGLMLCAPLGLWAAAAVAILVGVIGVVFCSENAAAATAGRASLFRWSVARWRWRARSLLGREFGRALRLVTAPRRSD